MEHIFANAFVNPIIFDAVPTKAQMKSNTWGIYGTDLYVKLANNTAIKLSGTAVS